MLGKEYSAQDLRYFILSDYQYEQDYNFDYREVPLLRSVELYFIAAA